MKNYEALADLRAKATFHIEKAFDRGYEQGYNDCKVELTEEEAKAHYNEGYEDGTKAKDGERGSIYYGGYGDGLKDGYEKGLKHGQELRAEEVKCAEACGMKRAWNVAKKILSRHGEGYDATDREVFGTDDVFSLSASEAVSKLEAWEKKQKQTWEEKEDYMRDATLEESKSVNDYIKSISKETGVTFEEKQEQAEKSCDTCKHGEAYKQGSDITTMDDECGGCCSWNSKWTPKPMHEIIANIEEETADVCICLNELSKGGLIDDTNIFHWTEIKENRIKERFEDDK